MMSNVFNRITTPRFFNSEKIADYMCYICFKVRLRFNLVVLRGRVNVRPTKPLVAIMKISSLNLAFTNIFVFSTIIYCPRNTQTSEHPQKYLYATGSYRLFETM